MEARIKRLFSRKTSPTFDDLTGLSYDSAIPSQPPIRGTFPIAVNDAQSGIIALENYAATRKQRTRQFSDFSATASPDIPRRSLQHDTHNRSQSLGRRGRAVPADSGRTFSGLSLKSQKSLRKKRRTNTSTTGPDEAFQPEYIPPIPQHSWHIRNQSSHVDIILASSLKQHASGKRDYGEDVADRNINPNSKLISDSESSPNPPDLSSMRSIYLREKGLAGKTKSREKSPVGTSEQHVVKDEQSNTNNDVSHNFLTPSPMVTRISSDGRRPRLRNKSSSKRSLPEDQFSDSNSILVSTTHKTSIVSGTYRPSGKPNFISSPPHQPSRPAVPAPLEAHPPSITSGRVSTIRETMRDGSPVHVPSGWRTIDNFIIKPPAQESSTAVQETAEEDSSLSRSVDSYVVATDSASGAVTGEVNTRSSAGSEASTQTWPLVAVLETFGKNYPVSLVEQRPATTAANKSPITPPISPDDSQQRVHTPTVSPRKNNHSPAKSSTSRSRSRSRANSTTYSPFPKTVRPTVSRHASQMSGDALNNPLDASTNDATTDVGSRAKVDNAQARAGIVVDGASEEPSPKRIVNDTVDARLNILPAVINETVTPQVHNIREEQITREIHTHDVFHRIQPIIETNVLPTKHYVRNSAGDLTEIPASAVSSRPEDWQVERSPSTSTTSLSSDSVAPPAIQSSHTKKASVSTQYLTSVSDQPVSIPTRTSSMSSGAPRTDSAWRRPPTFEANHQNRSKPQTAAPQEPINRYDGAGDRYDDSESESSRSCRSEDSALLFRDAGYGEGPFGGGGMLPGLRDLANPTVEEREAAATLKRLRELHFR